MTVGRQKIDHEPFANTALRTKILKDKELSRNDHVTAAVARELSASLVEPAEPGSHLAKVQARLLSSKALGAEVVRVVETLRSVLHPTTMPEDETSDDEREEIAPEPHRKKAKALAEDDEVRRRCTPNSI